MADTGVRPAGGGSRPLLGLRRRPGRIALVLFRMPLRAYRHGQGCLLGHTFVLLTHSGRKTGKPHSTVAMVLRYEPGSQEVVICSAWGPDTDWFRNIKARPALRVDIGRESFTPEQRFLTEDESFAVVADCLRRHPWRFRVIAWVLGWGDLRSKPVARDLVHTRPFVSFRPAGAPAV
jgi:deazaflavin-dependent oxidoreductase (nitroreductase family)